MLSAITTQCEGWRRAGGAFTFGPVEWQQCTSIAIAILTVTQEGKTEQMPACQVCWDEAVENDIDIQEAALLFVQQPAAEPGGKE